MVGSGYAKKEDSTASMIDIHVVDLRRPDWVEYKEELDENAAEGQDSAHDDARDRLGVHALQQLFHCKHN